MVDALTVAEPQRLESVFWVRKENIFFEGGTLSEPALIENIAQTCAAGFGYLQRKNGGASGLGFIGGINKLQVHNLPGLGAKINTMVEVTYKLDNIYVVHGICSSEGTSLLECEMKIVQM